eukprot:gene7810-8657_t
MKKFKRRSFGGSASKLEQQEEAPPLDLSKEPSENMKELLNEITRKDQMATGKRMGYLNNFAQLVRCVSPDTDFGLPLNEILICLRVAFVSPAKEIRAASLRALRHLLQTEEQTRAVLFQRLDIFIVRSLDLAPAMEVERVQALRLVRKMIYLSPQNFPMTLAMSLAAISSDMSQNKDRMSRACLATLCELAVKNIQLASYCSSVNVIIGNILDCCVPRMNESLTVTLLHLFNHPNYRCFVRRSVGLEALLAPFTDLYYRHSSETPENLVTEDQRSRIDAARLALVTIFRSWPGIICMCDPEGNGLDSLMGVFRLPNVDVRDGILRLLYDVFCLRMPTRTTDFMEALNSCDPSTMQYSWKLSEGFIVGEALSLLKHRASGNRTNLVQSYIALVLNAFIDADLLESLVEVITTSDEELSIVATILLGELLHMANTILPPECSGSCSGHTHCLPTLMSLATNLEVSSSKRGKASAAIGYLDQIHQVKKRGAIPCTIFLSQLLSQAQHQVKHSKSFREKNESTILRETDEILAAIKDSQVLTHNDFLLHWHWDLISAVLDAPRLSIKRQDDPTHLKFVRRLLQFYKPSNKHFCLVEIENKLAKKLSEVGLQLVDFLLRKEEQPEGEKLLLELVQEISDALTEASSTGPMTGVFCTSSIMDTLSRDYLLFIGRLSSSTLGTRCLEKSSGVFQHILEISSIISREYMLKLILSSFDYGRDGIARVILAKALTASPLASRLYSTKFMRVLLRAKTPYFSNWGMELLTNQLYDQENEVVAEAIDVLQEACEDEANLQRLIEIRPALLHLGEKGVILLIRYLSVSRGFTYLSEVDYVEPLLTAWKNTFHCQYVHWIEVELAEALTLFQRQVDGDNYIRRSSNERIAKKDVFVIPHLYGELAQHRTGIKLIQEKGFLKDSINTLLDGRINTAEDVLNLKASLWGLGHIGSTNWGIALLNPSAKILNDVDYVDEDDCIIEDDCIDVIREIVALAQDCDVLTIRGTCYYVLGLIAKTSQGADKLQDLGWDCVRHKGVETWPVIEQEVAFLPEDYVTDDESGEADSAEEAEENVNNSTSGSGMDRFGGVYLGDEGTEFPESVVSEAFEYTRITLGEDKKPKGKKRSSEDEKSSDAEEKGSLSDFKSRNLSVDDLGNFSELSLSLMSGVERLVDSECSSAIYSSCDDASIQTRNALQNELYLTLTNLEKQQQMKKMANQSDPNLQTSQQPPVKSTPKKANSEAVATKRLTRSIFDNKAGIYLGEETVEEPIDEREALLMGSKLFGTVGSGTKAEDLAMTKTDSITTTKEAVNSSARPVRMERMFSVEHQLDNNLRPIREVDSRENIADMISEQRINSLNAVTDATADIDISVEEVVVDSNGIEIQIPKNREDYRNGGEVSSLKTESLTSQYSSLPSEENNWSRQSPVDFRGAPSSTTFAPRYGNNDKRARSLSFPIRKDSTSSIPGARSVSFSGGSLQNGNDIGHCRSESDPGMSGDSRAESYDSQESDDKEVKILGSKQIIFRNYEKHHHGSRSSNKNRMFSSDLSVSKLGLRDRSDSDERRAKSFLPDLSNASRRLRRPRGNTMASLSMSPASFSYGESPVVSSARDAFGYAAWTTLRKRRNYRKEMDLKIHQSSAISPYRQILDRKLMDGRNFPFGQNDMTRVVRQVSVPASLYMISRRHFSATTSISSTGSDAYASTTPTDGALISEDYVGRCLPVNLYDILRLNSYEYKGSWADNFKPLNGGQVLSENEDEFVHSELRCLHCMMSLTMTKISSKSSTKSTPRKSLDKKDEKKNSKSPLSKTDSGFPKKKLSASSMPLIDASSEERFVVHKEILRLIVNLSSSVASKASQQSLIALKEQYPWAFEDLCVYSQMMDQLGTYTFRLSIRRFIQAMFDSVNYQTLFQQADAVLGRPAEK